MPPKPTPPRKPPAATSRPTRRLTPLEVLERLQHRVEQRIVALERVKLEGFEMVLAELKVELDFLHRASNYLADRDAAQSSG